VDVVHFVVQCSAVRQQAPQRHSGYRERAGERRVLHDHRWPARRRGAALHARGPPQPLRLVVVTDVRHVNIVPSLDVVVERRDGDGRVVDARERKAEVDEEAPATRAGRVRDPAAGGGRA
jgi:hypothetical protein